MPHSSGHADRYSQVLCFKIVRLLARVGVADGVLQYLVPGQQKSWRRAAPIREGAGDRRGPGTRTTRWSALPTRHTSGWKQARPRQSCYDPLVVPGLLQTEAYARAIVVGGPNELSAEQVDQRVAIRTERQQLLTRTTDPLRLWVVLDEAALRKKVGGAKVMREQLRCLLEMSELAKVTLQVITDEAGAHPGMTRPFTVLTFPRSRTCPRSTSIRRLGSFRRGVRRGQAIPGGIRATAGDRTESGRKPPNDQ